MAKNPNEIQNNAMNAAKNVANQQRYTQNMYNAIGVGNTQAENELAAYNSAFNNSRLKSLTDEYSNLNDSVNTLLMNKFGNKEGYDVSQGYIDSTDTSGYAEYLRLVGLLRQNEEAQRQLEASELNRKTQLASQDAIRMQQQKYLDEYAKMQGMGYGGYSAGLQADTYNRYANEVANINSAAYDEAEQVMKDYRDAEYISEQERLQNAYSAQEQAKIDVVNALIDENDSPITSQIDFIEKMNTEAFKSLDPNIQQQLKDKYFGISNFSDKNGGWDDDVKVKINGEDVDMDIFYNTDKRSGLNERLTGYKVEKKELENLLNTLNNIENPIVGQIYLDEGHKRAFVYTDKGWALMEYKGNLKSAYNKVKNYK